MTDLVTRCWNCGKQSDSVATVDYSDGTPDNGDVSLCFYCGQPAIFDDTREDGVRKPTPSEMAALRRSPEVVAAMQAWSITKTITQ